MTTVSPVPRTGHPYHMYEAIHAQPDAVADCLRRHRQTAERVAEAIAARRRFLLAGIGTSFHAATVGEGLVCLLSGHRADARAVHSFELVHYGHLGPHDALLVVSHRGTKTFSMQALEAGRRAGALCVAVTGLGHGATMDQADVVLETVPQEASGAHTVSYTTAMATLALLALALARRAGAAPEAEARALEALPGLLRRALALEPRCREVAERFAGYRRFLFMGAGPNTATAWEVGLKMKEASYTQAEGLHLEQALHGPPPSFGPETVITAIAPPGPGRERAVALLRAARAVGAPTLALGAEEDAPLAAEADHALLLPAVPEALSPIVYVVPLQLLTYYSALARGTNPDLLRREDPTYAQMHAQFRL